MADISFWKTGEDEKVEVHIVRDECGAVEWSKSWFRDASQEWHFLDEYDGPPLELKRPSTCCKPFKISLPIKGEPE